MPGLRAVDHEFTVPLDHADPAGPSLTVFAREVSDPALGDDLPWALFLQGGPGGKSPRPTGPGSWSHVLKTHRVLFLDQRGTGRSTPAPLDALRHFRADSIVADCEHIRRSLGISRWETWGQSYGGFITLTYLSQAPEALRACHITGGLPGLDATADDVYSRTYPRVRAKIETYFRRYPADEAKIARIASHLDSSKVLLPDGDQLTSRRFRTLGMRLGMGDGMETLHWLLDEAWTGAQLSDTFLYDVMTSTGFVSNPLYAVLHESIYTQGPATRWSADRLLPADLPLTGEMIYPWMFTDIRALRPYAEAAAELANATDWPLCTTRYGWPPTRSRWPP